MPTRVERERSNKADAAFVSRVLTWIDFLDKTQREHDVIRLLPKLLEQEQAREVAASAIAAASMVDWRKWQRRAVLIGVAAGAATIGSFAVSIAALAVAITHHG